MKQIYLYCFFSVLFINCNKRSHSYSLEIESKHTDSLFEVVYHESTTKEKKIIILNKLYTGIASAKSDSSSRKNLIKIANQYFYLNDFEKYLKVTRDIIKLSKKANDTINLAKGYQYLGDYFFEKSQNDSSFFYFTKSEKFYSRTLDKENLGRVKLKKSYLLYRIKDYSGSEINTIRSLKIANEVNDKTLLYECYNFLGIILTDLKKFDQAIIYHKKALEIIFEIKDMPQYHKLFQAQSYNNLGTVYLDSKNYSKAIDYYSKGIKVDNLYNLHPVYYAAILDNLGYSKFKQGNKDVQKLFLKSLKIRDSLNDISGIVTGKTRLAEFYLNQKDTINALKNARDANQKAKFIANLDDELKTLLILSKADPKKSNYYYQEYIDLNSNSIDNERMQRDKFARIEFETDEILNQKNTIETEKNKISFQRWTILGFSLLSILIVILWYLNKAQRSKNKQLELVQEQQKANQEIYRLMLDQQQKIEEGKQIEKKRISQELHDGVMGKLSSIRLNLFILTKKTDTETINRCIEHIKEIQNIEKEIRTIAHDLNKNLFSDNINFISVVKNLFIAIENHSDINFNLNFDGNIDWEIINGNIKMQIYRVLQEVLQNIDKHANASKVSINIKKIENTIAIDIIDNGIGFDNNKIIAGIGLKSIKERVKEIKGKIEIKSVIGEGTKINLIFPI